ncbi:MAG: hypothetical protein HDT37_05285 [Clostridiales bacterium]|nr:hypothetical protein [Clostridiales bacterium]
MIFQAAVSNKAHPEYGLATIPFPIPDSEYDQAIELLEGLDIGSPTGQDCQVDFLDSKYPILKRLVTQSVNLDELDYLAKRLESFCPDENAQFQAMASKMCLSDIQDFINLTFCCQQATVITDFSNLAQAGRSHSLTINGGSMPTDEFDEVDGLAVALDLIQSGAGMVTPYGVVYDNGMELEQIYDGRHLPEYYYGPCVATVTLSGQNLVLIRLRSKGCIDPVLALSQADEMSRKLRDLRRLRRKVLETADGDEQTQSTEAILDYLETAQWQAEVTPELFENLVERIIVVSAEEVKFRLLNGLELAEGLV